MLEYHLGDPKSYRATVCFGATSTTDDLEGELVPAEGPAPDRETVVAALAGFRGAIVQMPPAYSALKVGGRRAYALARAGETPALSSRQVTISRLELVEWDASDAARPVAVLDVDCSAGTYIRALARDLGSALGSGGYLGALVRTASGPFRLAEAHDLDVVRSAAAAGQGALAALLLRPDAGLEHFPAVVVGGDDLVALARGQAIRLPDGHEPTGGEDAGTMPGTVRLVDEDGALVAVGVVRSGLIAPDKVFLAPPVRPVSPEFEAAIMAERDAADSVDPDPASPDDV
jgi:tRNA pseudouridine55 synthase